MFRRHIASHAVSQPPVVEVTPSPAMLSAIARASALMAQVDGQAEAVERQSFLRFLRSRDLLHRFGRTASSAAYQAALDSGMTAEDILEQLSPYAAQHEGQHAGQHGAQHAASLVAAAAAHVAAADGLAHPAEIALLQRFRAVLGLTGDAERVLS
jgi:tellurite resistance protein